MGRPRHLRSAALALATLLALAGCGGDPQPAPPPTSSSPSPTTTPDAAPSMPALAKRKSPDGAKAFVGFFIQTMNAASLSGRTRTLRALYVGSCGNCEAIADGIDRVYSGGGRISGMGWTPHRFKTYGFDGERYPVDALITAGAQVVVAKPGAKPTRYPGEKSRVEYFDIAWRTQGWTTIGLDEGR